MNQNEKKMFFLLKKNALKDNFQIIKAVIASLSACVWAINKQKQKDFRCQKKTRPKKKSSKSMPYYWNDYQIEIGVWNRRIWKTETEC